MKKILLLLMAIFAFGLQNVKAQDAPIKIVTGHPDLKVKLKSCKANGNTVFIDLILSNIGENDIKQVDVCGGRWKSEAYDDEGNLYNNDLLQVKGSVKPEYNVYDTGDFGMPSGVPVKLSISIERVPQSVESISRLMIVVNSSELGLNDSKPIKISNIPILRD